MSRVFFLLLYFINNWSYAQVFNYVRNGSFEDLLDTLSPQSEYKCKGWSGVDSTKSTATYYRSPGPSPGFQTPYHGYKFLRGTYYCSSICSPTLTRSNIKNRLKQPLINGKIYCFKMYVNLQNEVGYGIDGFDVYFGGDEVDTIIYNARQPLTFLTPQVSNPVGNVITDTLNWTLITGTFVAKGGEKYMVIGNFRSDAITTKVPAGNQPGIYNWSEYFVDNVSCVEMSSGFAGRDTLLTEGDSVYLGKIIEPDIQDSIIWFQYPSTTPISTLAGMWVKPETNTTYVVKWQVCGGWMSDTVTVFVNGVGIQENYLGGLRVSPNPSSGLLFISGHHLNSIGQYTIFDMSGRLMASGAISGDKSEVRLQTHLEPGMYTFCLSYPTHETLYAKILITQ